MALSTQKTKKILEKWGCTQSWTHYPQVNAVKIIMKTRLSTGTFNKVT